MPFPLSRRDFLGSVASALAPTVVRRPHVAILGAGIAGLCAGFELRRRGFQVTILEATSRPGGRIRTLREPFAEGLYAEAGATRIPDNHLLTQHYIRHFGLPLERFAPPLDGLYFFDGHRVRARERGHWPLALTPEEQQLGIEGMNEKYVVPVVRETRQLPRDGLSLPAVLRRFEGRTFPELLRDQGASLAAVRLLTLGYNVHVQSAAWWLAEEVSLARTKEIQRITGGNDRLPAAFAKHLSEHILYGAEVVRLEQDGAGATVIYRRAGERQILRADRVICTIPFAVLRGIERAAHFSPAKERVIRELRYTPVTKVYVQCRRRVWLEEGLSGVSYTDLPLARTWPGAGLNPRGRGILHSYMWGAPAEDLDRLEADARVQRTAAEMERVFPALRGQWEGGTSYSWTQDRFARGGFTEYLPGQMETWPALAAQAEGRYHFAGEHTHVLSGWIQGSLESALRAVQECAVAERRG